MDLKEQIKALFNEAELYRGQGLYTEAVGKYKEVHSLIKANKNLPNRGYLLKAMSSKIDAVEDRLEAVRSDSRSPELSDKIQDLIKNLFSFSDEENEDLAALEGVIALAKFGQTDRALGEFKELIQIDALRMTAAKNVLRCHVMADAFDEAVNEYRQWLTDGPFSEQQIESIRLFLQKVLDKKGVDRTLPSVLEPAAMQDEAAEPSMSEAVPIEPRLTEEILMDTPPTEEEEMPDEDILDICTMGITLESGPEKGRMVELDVNFQRGNTITFMISNDDKELIDKLQVGVELDDVQFSSPFAVFGGSGVVASKTRIEEGPKQGNYMIDVKVKSA